MEELQELEKTNEQLTNSIVDIVGELFRFRQVFIKAVKMLDPEDQSKYMGRFSWFAKRIVKAADNAGLRIVDLTDQEYDPGMAVNVLNIEDFDKEDVLEVDQMMEPIIMKGDQIQKTGTVVLRRKDI